MTDDPSPAFIDYWNAVDQLMLKRYAIDIADAGIETETIASAHEDGWSPEEFAVWFGEKYGLMTRAEWNVFVGRRS